MRRILPSLLLAVIIVLSAILILQSCATPPLTNDASSTNTAITRLYISLSSKRLQREYEVGDVEKILVNHFNGATMQESTGIHNGKKERSLVITIINCCSWEEPKEKFQEKINNLVMQLRNDLGQESILVEYIAPGKTEAFELYE